MTRRATPAERARYRVEVEQPDLDTLHVLVASPDGNRRAQWWVLPVMPQCPAHEAATRAHQPIGYDLCSRPGVDENGQRYVIHSYRDYGQATRAAMLRARHWLGSCWGLRGPARRLP